MHDPETSREIKKLYSLQKIGLKKLAVEDSLLN